MTTVSEGWQRSRMQHILGLRIYEDLIFSHLKGQRSWLSVGVRLSI